MPVLATGLALRKLAAAGSTGMLPFTGADQGSQPVAFSPSRAANADISW
jgi:hypothetical protein